MPSVIASQALQRIERGYADEIFPQLGHSIAMVLRPEVGGEDAVGLAGRGQLQTHRVALIERFQRRLRERLTLLSDASRGIPAFDLALVEENALGSQLELERMVENLSHVQHKGLRAFEQRLCAVLERPVLGAAMPLSPQAIAAALSHAWDALEIDDGIRLKLVRDFALRLDPHLCDLLKQLNESLARDGVLPDLIIQDEEERQRRQTLVEPPAPVSESTPQAVTTSGHAPARPDLPRSARDQVLLDKLSAQLQALRERNRAMGLVPSGPQRVVETPTAVQALSQMQKAGSGFLRDALTQPDGSVAASILENLSREVSTDEDILGGVTPTLGEEEQSRVELSGGLFGTMLRDRAYSDSVRPLLLDSILPFVRATLTDPDILLQPEHPLRRLVNTISEVCEDNEGESKWDRELIELAGNAVAQVKQEEQPSFEFYEQVSLELSERLDVHRQRAALAEKRAAEAQKGQERLEHARASAMRVCGEITQGRAMPAQLRDFLGTEWQHFLSLSMLRKGEDSPEFAAAERLGRHWMDVMDMVELGEPVPEKQVEQLQQASLPIWQGSGEPESEARQRFEGLMQAVRGFDVAEAEAESSTPIKGGPVNIAATDSTLVVAANEPLPQPEVDIVAFSPEDLQAVSQLAVGTWLQIPKGADGVQQVKISWVSGISGSVMLVNRRGQRVAVLSPEELAMLRAEDRLLVFDSDNAVDQSMSAFLQRLSRSPAPARAAA